VFARDLARALAVASASDPASAPNGPTVHDEAQMPFGGSAQWVRKVSRGEAAIREFTDLRWITIQTSARRYSILNTKNKPMKVRASSSARNQGCDHPLPWPGARSFWTRMSLLILPRTWLQNCISATSRSPSSPRVWRSLGPVQPGCRAVSDHLWAPHCPHSRYFSVLGVVLESGFAHSFTHLS